MWGVLDQVWPLTTLGVCGAIVIVAACCVFALIGRRRYRDLFFAGVTPGMTPADPSTAEVTTQCPETVAVRVTPPDGLEPADATVITTGRLTADAVTATIVSLVSDGFATMDTYDTQVTLTRTSKPVSEDGHAVVSDFQGDMLGILNLHSGDTVTLGSVIGTPETAHWMNRKVTSFLQKHADWFQPAALAWRARQRLIGLSAVAGGIVVFLAATISRLGDVKTMLLWGIAAAVVAAAVGVLILQLQGFRLQTLTIVLWGLIWLPVFAMLLFLFLLLPFMALANLHEVAPGLKQLSPVMATIVLGLVGMIPMYVGLLALVGPFMDAFLPIKRPYFTALVVIPIIVWVTALTSFFGLWLWLLGAILGGGVLLAALRNRPPLTAEGSAALAQTLGFKKYLATAETAQLSFEATQDLYAGYLPWAVALDEVNNWSASMEAFGHLDAPGLRADLSKTDKDASEVAAKLAPIVRSIDDLARAGQTIIVNGSDTQQMLDGLGRKKKAKK